MLKKLFKEFKDFASRGEVISLAIGVIIGSAFKGVIDSFVTDIIMPPISILTSKVDFTQLFISLDGNKYENLNMAREVSAPVIAYGNFINQIIVFLITALAIFIFVYKTSEFLKKKEVKESSTKKCTYCRMKINKEAVKCPYCTSKLS